ncbi:hypothetical protein BDQ17DRAFT_1353142 [Cyathus striatus]|nr:hypothetical protein BDQ17DRAFT_1353142 [Cyathus striatus]
MPVFLRKLSRAALRTFASFRIVVSAFFSPRKSPKSSEIETKAISHTDKEECDCSCPDDMGVIALSDSDFSQERRETPEEETDNDKKDPQKPVTERPGFNTLRQRRSRRLTGIDLSYQTLPPSTSGDDLLKWTLVKEALANSPCSSFSSLSSMRFSAPSVVQLASPGLASSSGSGTSGLYSPPSTSLSLPEIYEKDHAPSMPIPPSKVEAAAQFLKETVLQEESSRYLAPPTLPRYRASFSRSMESLTDYYSTLSS